MKTTWFCQGCRKPIADDEAGYDGCHIGCGHVLVTKGEAVELAMQLLEFAGWQPMDEHHAAEFCFQHDLDKVKEWLEEVERIKWGRE